MRAFLMFLCLSMPLGAEEFRAAAPVVEVTIHPQGAIVIREVQLDLPAGRHRILLPHQETVMTIEATGARLGATSQIDGGIDSAEAFYSVAQQAAHDAVKTAEAETRAAQSLVDLTRSAVAAFEAEIVFLESLRGGNVSDFNAEATIAAAIAVRDQSLRAREGLIAARGRLPALEDALQTATERQTAAMRAFERSVPPQVGADMQVIALEMDAPGQATLRLTELSVARWDLRYFADLVGEQVFLHRKATIRNSGAPWDAVHLTISTQNLEDQIAADRVRPDHARLQERRSPAFSSQMESPSIARAIGMDPVVIVEDTSGPSFEGPAITYAFDNPVTLAAEDEITLDMQTLLFEADTYNRASPKFDDNAFLMARLTNTSPEMLLPGEVVIQREGALIGSGEFYDIIPAGADFELGFGPQRHLVLERTLLENATGDRGLLSTSETRVQDLRFTVQNLGDQPEVVEVYYALPFAEQEDLRLQVATNPRPSARDVDDQRGVSRWDMTVGPGETQGVQMRFEFAWPEGSELIWRP